jgi:hypothetical protein
LKPDNLLISNTGEGKLPIVGFIHYSAVDCFLLLCSFGGKRAIVADKANLLISHTGVGKLPLVLLHWFWAGLQVEKGMTSLLLVNAGAHD